jgi:lipoprotein NlpI
MLTRLIARVFALLIAIAASAAVAEDWEDCKQGTGTVGLKGCTAWLAQEKKPDKRAFIYHRRGLVFELAGEYERSLLDFNTALELKPDNANWYTDRALLYFLKEDLEAAAADTNRALSMEPSRYAYQIRGFILYHKHDFAGAAADFARVLEMQPDDPLSAIHRYLAKARLGEDALAGLRADAARLTAGSFYFTAVELYLGKVSPDVLLAQDDAQSGCQSRYFIGALNLLRKKPEEAASWFEQAAGICDGAAGRWWFVSARAELKTLPH